MSNTKIIVQLASMISSDAACTSLVDRGVDVER